MASDLTKLTDDALRSERHELGNTVQRLMSRLWLLDDEIERRARLAEIEGLTAYRESGIESSKVVEGALA